MKPGPSEISKHLQSLLLLRGVVDVLVAIYFFAAPASDAAQALHQTGYYSACDGLLALAVAVALRGHARAHWLFGLALIDALMRLAVGALIFAYPNVESRVLTAVVFFSAMIVLCISIGLYGLVYVAVGRRVEPQRRAGTAWPAAVASGCTLLLGLGLIVGLSTDQGRRWLVASNALVLGLTWLAAGICLTVRLRTSS